MKSADRESNGSSQGNLGRSVFLCLPESPSPPNEILVLPTRQLDAAIRNDNVH
ncbi:hypothetical protein RBSH_01791 [Rhodopirellula baltica SH28]|uniref:Uncharacterized protein n=1 Tax=Rhodopirellula baltica SH28 TaxID=993517 RepID=K5DKV3_RHOBT|nr:hypothetical protein RBSH_01791 [Rhodopirellula baltica SH28]